MTIQTEFPSAWNAMTSSILKRWRSLPERPTIFPRGRTVAPPAISCRRALRSKGVNRCWSTGFMGLPVLEAGALEHKPNLGLQRPRRDEMSSAERGEEVVQRRLVGEIDDFK